MNDFTADELTDAMLAVAADHDALDRLVELAEDVDGGDQNAEPDTGD